VTEKGPLYNYSTTLHASATPQPQRPRVYQHRRRAQLQINAAQDPKSASECARGNGGMTGFGAGSAGGAKEPTYLIAL
jgi:hypothetical protein